MSFLMDGVQQFVSIKNTATPETYWSYSFIDENSSGTDDSVRRKDPTFLHPDPRDDSVLYLTGRYYGHGSIMRFQKRNAKLRWWAKFETLSNIRAYAQVPEDDHFYACGDYNSNSQYNDLTLASYSAGIFRMKNDGSVKWFIQVSGKNPEGVNPDGDRCFGIAYDAANVEISILIQTKSKQVRQLSSGNYYDTLLAVIDSSGDLHSAVTFTWGNELQYDMFSAQQGLFNLNNRYIFGGFAYGYKTRSQELTKSLSDPDFDVYIFNYEFDLDSSYSCTYENEVSRSEWESIATQYSSTNVGPLYTLYNRDTDVPMQQQQQYYYPYSSRYSGGFTLLDSFKIPRPCAFATQNLTEMEYYRGQNLQQYKIIDNNRGATVVTQMDTNTQLLYQNGTNASYIGYFEQQDYSVWVQTDDEDAVGTQKTIIRNCNGLTRLLELNLYINVLSNTYPDFEEDIETTYSLWVGNETIVDLPRVIDSEGNDESEVYVDYMEAQEDKYPPFLTFANDSNTLIIFPNDTKYQGFTYYFTIIVKEKNSESVLYPYYCTIKVEGDIIIPNTTIDYVNISWAIGDLFENSTGRMSFNHTVNMSFVNENFYEMFTIYFTDTTYRRDKKTYQLDHFWPHIFFADNQTMNFTMVFEKPYMLGLLQKKTDYLRMNVTEGFNYSGLWDGYLPERERLVY